MRKFTALLFCIAIVCSSLTGCLVRPDVDKEYTVTGEEHSHNDEAENKDSSSPADTTDKPDNDTTKAEDTQLSPDTTDNEETTAPPEHDHDYTVEKVSPTCTGKGYTKYTCACGKTFSEAFIDAKGHSYTSAVTNPTENAGGYTTHTCSECGYSYKDSYTDKLSSDGGASTTNKSFFDNSVFVGDSVSEMLEIYEGNTNVFGKATFLCETGLALYNYAADNSYGKVTYNDQKMKIEDAVAACGAKNVFILLGTNDLVWVNIDKIIANYQTLINNIKAKVPGVQIYIQSGTPIYPKDHGNNLTNANMEAYNAKLQNLASANGCKYIDIATPFKDENGALDAAYCSDNYVHLNYAACKIWVETIKNFVGIQ